MTFQNSFSVMEALEQATFCNVATIVVVGLWQSGLLRWLVGHFVQHVICWHIFLPRQEIVRHFVRSLAKALKPVCHKVFLYDAYQSTVELPPASSETFGCCNEASSTDVLRLNRIFHENCVNY